MTIFSLYKLNGMVWHNPSTFLLRAVYANGKGPGAGTRVS